MASNSFPVAVIGMAVKLPGAESCDEFWKLIMEGQDTVGEFPSERAADISHVLPSFESHLIDEDKPFFTGSFFKSVDEFDADLFQINPKEAMYIEPQQRFFLETAWKLLEDAGYASRIRGSKTGVYVGNTVNKYKFVLTENHPSISHGNHSPFVSSRVSYTLDLTGPAMMVATGCSSSLLAVHLACQGLLSGDCDTAIAGGITIDLLPISTKTDIWNQLGITGPNVKCRAFDACAKGIAKGEGCGAVLLKPLEKALSDGDHVYGILQATTANQDGHSNGITAPHPVAQASLLHTAWKLADITPDKLGYFEAHGTGTELGDPIEISGITKAVKMSEVNLGSQSNSMKIPVGSVKANIGHLADGAAGVVALIKTLLCMNHDKIPAAVNFSKANPHINWQKAPVYVNTSTIDWKPNADKSPRFASVSAFGLLGTNVHAVVKEHVSSYSATTEDATKKSEHSTILVLAAASKESLLAFVQRMLEYFRCSDNKSLKHLQNVCFTINTGREQDKFESRAIAYGETWDEMTQVLQDLHESLDNISSNDSRIRVSAGFSREENVPCPTKQEDKYISSRKVKEDFLNGKAIQWNKVYPGRSSISLHKVPFLPTYAFNKVRYWPKKGEPVNKDLVCLEHHLSQSDVEEETNSGYLDIRHNNSMDASSHSLELQGVNETQTHDCQKQIPKSSQSKGADLLLSEALNEALGKEYDWMLLKDENLFSLGVDSLICTHVNMRIKDALVLNAEAFTMSDLHMNPSYGSLLKVIQAKMRPLSFESDEGTGFSPPHLATSTKGLYPLSFAQKRLWVMQELVTNPCVYNATNCLKISGQFHPAAFVLSANTVLSCHGAFFTIFANTPNGLFQTHNWTQQVKVTELDYRNSGDISEELAMKEYEKDYKTPFDLEQGPLVRCKLYYLSKDEYLFTMVIHHIIFDGWSHFNFYNELWHSYRKACNGVVEEHPIHKPLYVELVSEEQKEATSGSSRIVTDLAHWKQKLCGPLPLTSFPGDKRRPPVFSYNGGRITRFIGNDVLSSLVKLTGDEYTMFMALVATVFSLLHQYTGESDLIIGTPVAGRYDTKTKGVIGCFVNTVVLRLHLKGDMTFNEILESVSKVCLDAYDHQRAPFDLLVGELSLPRDTSITPIFSVNVCYHNTEVKGEHVSPPKELHIERKLLHNNSSKWDMQFDFLQEEEGMRFTLEYYSDVYSKHYAECVAENLVGLINRATREPSVPISRLPVSEVSNNDGLSPTMCVLHGAITNVGDKALPNLLIESLCHFADESFIIDMNGKSIAYSEVLKKAGKIAVFLREKCEIPNHSRIGLLLNNSIESLASILACVLSGLVYVPLNCDDPKHRLEHICNESELKAIIFSKPNIAIANNLLWGCQSVSVLFCVDEETFEEVLESPKEAPLMSKELWDHMAFTGEDDIEAGGWKSSYTGENFSELEMNEYAENVLKKLQQYIKPHSRILEIGCASGLTTKKLYPLVERYIATDLSQSMTDRLSNDLKESKTVEFICASAHEVGHLFQGQEFDIIILNSVVHCFPGHNYLRKVLHSCDSILQENGIIFVGDIMDLEKKDKLVWKLKTFKASYPWHRTKTEWHNELFLSRKHLQHLCDTSQELKSVCFSPKIFTVQNELTEFRFDAIFSKSLCPEASFKTPVNNVTTCANGDLQDALNGIQDSEILATLTNWSRKIDFADEAYVLYTSGTTGTPKGVIIGQRALLNYVQWASKAYKLDKGSTLPLFSPLTFDFTVTSICPSFLNGSTIRIFKSFQDSYQDLALCPELTTVKFSPLQLDTVLSATNSPLSASIFIVGGEELTSELLQKLKRNKKSEKFEVWNEYGPTEATVGCVVKCFYSDDLPLDESEYVTIGKPIDNVTIAVTRNRSSHVPIGGKGRLCIGGKCLCLDFAGTGSLKDTKFTESFEVACWGDPGELMLVTDDIAGVMPASGEIAYYGREESSTVKVNGVRVDLMEIQHAIESHHLIHSAWVSSFTYSNYTYLGAAVKLKPTTNLPSSSVETWKQVLISSLTTNLPTRCIPKVLVSVSDPPTNSYGKKDKSILQGLFEAELQSELEISDDSISDRTTGISAIDASKLQVLWQSILPIKRLPNLDDDFFLNLSGDSLQAIHLVRKMRREGYQVSVGDVFQNPTIRKLLQALQSNTVVPIQKQSIVREEVQTFRPTPIIEEFLKRNNKNADHFALSSLLRFERRLETNDLKVALTSVMDKHSSLRSRFEIVEGMAVQEVVQSYEPTVKRIKLSCQEDHLVKDAGFLDLCQNLEQSHSLSEGILMSVGVIDVSKKEDTEATEKECTYVLLVVHHIAIDIVSWQQVLEDLATALKMLSADEGQEHLILPQKCILPFASFCNALHEQASGIFAEEIDYWKNIDTQGAESGLLIKEQRQSTFESAKWLSLSFDAVTLRTISARLKCSEEHILLTILGRALSSIHGKDRTAIVLESHGRQLPYVDSTSTVGWCTSMFPFVLEALHSGDKQKQVKEIEKKVKQIPHHGLGFGLLKTDGKLKTTLPNIMFVFQGSLDASTKQEFDGGKYTFQHVPWIEVMQSDLTQRRFHRHPEEILAFDLEIVAWIHGGQLKIGFLFDTKTICESLMETLVDHAENDLKMFAKELKCCTKVITAEIIPSFNISPDCIQTAKNSLMEHGIHAEKVLVYPPDQALQSMIESVDKRYDVTVIVTRHTTENQADEFKKAYQDFLEARRSNKVIIVNAESIPNSVKLPEEIDKMDGNIVELPSSLGPAFYNKLTDVEYNMPLTQEGYSQMGLIIARSIRARINGNKYKVIAVDADYTLWDGECAYGCVDINTGNICLQKFLLKKKREGLLLVILSKNSYQDVVKVFERQRDQMILGLDDIVEIVANWNSKADNVRTVANQLNLDLNSFVFIDDNPLECEEMVTSCPEILTLQLPSNPNVVGNFLDDLWILDSMDVSKESSNRTEMYRNESARQKEIDKVKKGDAASKRQAEVTSLLAKWKMKLTFLKTNISSIKQTKTLLKRTVELLHRTNQFKLNDAFTKFSDFQEEDACWIISLDDCHGSYGIVSVCVIDKSLSNLKQWVLSCRALGREVESRILSEMHASFKDGLQLSVSRTERNAPAIIFLETLGCSIGKTGLIDVTIQDIHPLQTDEGLHTIEIAVDAASFTEKIYSKKDSHQHFEEDMKSNISFPLPSPRDVSWAIEVEWSPTMKEQSKRHNLFPISRSGREFKQVEETSKRDDCHFSSSRTHVLQSVWMEVLKSDQKPQGTDNFLELGGNSFSAVFLVSKLGKALNIEISVTDVLRYPKFGDFENLVLQAPKTNEANECKSLSMQCPPVSAAQQRMLIMQESAPDSTAYVETVALYTGKKPCPSEIFGSLVKQHPILKAKFEFSNERLCYVMSTHENLDIHTECEPVENLKTASEYLTRSIPRINVISSPLVRFRHLEAGGITILAMHVHHAIVDEITLLSISNDLGKLIDGQTLNFQSGKDLCDPFVNLQDNVSSLQQNFNQQYWTGNFKTLPPEVSLAILPQTQALWKDTEVYKAEQSKFPIADEVVINIIEYCQSMGITPFQYFLACTLMVLQRYLGVDEVTLAIPVTTRTDVTQHTDGLFVNTVLFRCPIDCNVTFKSYMKAVADRWLQTLRHAQYPFDELVKILTKQHRKSPSSFCCTMFNFTSQVKPANALEVRPKHAKMPLSLDVLYNENEGTSEVVVEWASELIDDGVAKRLADGLVNTFGEPLKEPDTVLYKVTTLSPLEHKLLQSFSKNSEENTTDSQPIQVLFEEHAAVNPEAIAIFSNGSTVSYAQLNGMASNISCALRRKFTKAALKSRPIVIVMNKDEYAIASILGIWKAGGHFLPVASNLQSVLKQILERCNPLAVIFNVSLEGNVETCPVIDVKDLVNHHPENILTLQEVMTHGSDNLAYIIRTSGSTGEPKQCKISHKSLKTIAQAWTKKYKMKTFCVRVLQWAPISFDVFIGDVVRALVCTSGQLIICPDQFRLDVFHVLALIKKHQITVAEVTPQFGLHLIENRAKDDLLSLRLLILGSDVLQNHVFQNIKSAMNKEQRIINSYGMTEATIDSSFYEGPMVSKTRSGTVPIGKSLPGVWLHVLDTKTRLPCPVGTVGELYISGDVLASGDVEVTQLNETCLALKTGDAACWLPTGDVDLIGRLDSVVKLRGFRISTHEIENKIVAFVKGVREAYVVPMLNEVDESQAASEFLCAFLVIDKENEKKMDVKAIRYQLRGHLPYYMVPDIYHPIDKAPLTTHGKLDLQALPSLSQILEINSVISTTQRSFNLSATAALLKDFLGEALGLPNSNMINPDLTFTELGVHSLILVRFSALIKQKSSLDVEIADLFSYPTITDLAEYIDHGKEVNHPVMTCSKERHKEEGKTEIKTGEEIAITGIGMRLPPNITSIVEFWRILDNGEDLIREFPQQRSKDVKDSLDDLSTRKLCSNETFEGAFLEEIEMFDSRFFKIPPGEAKYMSPEQRLFLQVATEALAEAKGLSKSKGAKIGVFVGSSEIGYAHLSHPDDAICISGLLPGMIATRVAYQWDLKGPTMLVDTACSSSLVALKIACESIRNNECEGALVGGVSLVLYPSRSGVFGHNSILSDDFHCRAFDRDASGTAVGEGVMCLYVEPISKAVKEGKPIYGLIKGAASNSVGHGNGITAPTAISQQMVIQDALTAANLQPSDISFLEAHGTGTNLGDRIELSALSAVFGGENNETQLPIGSIKTIFGHLDSAAGMIGVLKILASFMTKQIGPTANFSTPNRELENSLMYVPSKSVPWEARGPTASRIAGISSFGLTGTNCHVIIQECNGAPESQDRVSSEAFPLLFSGRSIQQILKQISKYKIILKESIISTSEVSLLSLCVTIARRLKDLSDAKVGHIAYRMAITGAKADELLPIMETANSLQEMKDVVMFANLRNDVHFYGPGNTQTHCQDPFLRDFLADGTIELDGLFACDTSQIQSARGVPVVIYDEERHWLDACAKSTLVTQPVGLVDLLQKKIEETRELTRTLPLSPPEELSRLQGKFCAAVIINFLKATNIAGFLSDGKEISMREAFLLSGMHKKYEKLFFVMIRELFRNHLVSAAGCDKSMGFLDSFKFESEHFLEVDPEVIANTAIEIFPPWADCFRFPLYCSKYFKDVLVGKMSPLSVIYPQGNLNFMHQFDKLGDLLGDVYYNMYMQIIAEYAKQLSTKRETVRVLEVGAGVGHVTRQLLPKMKDIPNIEYWFTDLGKAFVENAKSLFPEYLHMMKLATFDITKSASKQGVLGSFDIVISYNVIHTTESIIKSVVNLKSCLGEEGILFIIESARNDTWATLAWGLLDGWWYFKDYDLRSAEPMLEVDKWEAVLKDIGFGSICTCPVNEDERRHVEKCLFACSNKRREEAYVVRAGWWETDAHRFDPHQTEDNAEDMGQCINNGTESKEEVQDQSKEIAVYQELKRIWSQLLGIDRIHCDDDFNSLGGESLLAIQMMRLVRQRIGFQLEIADTFGYPTLGSLAAFIAENLPENPVPELPRSVQHCLSSTTEASKSNTQEMDNNGADSIEMLNVASAKVLHQVKEVKERRTMIMFPGQGAQKRDMCLSMENSPEARAVFSRAEPILGYNVLEVLLDGNTNLEEKLESTEFVQVSLFLGCLAKVEQLKVERADLMDDITCIAGLSVGEFAALVYSGVLKFEDALQIVQKRGRAMEKEVKRTASGMVSVLGPTSEELELYLKDNFPEMKISTYLADNQHTVAGKEEDCHSLVELLSSKENQPSVIDVRKLRVAGGFHSECMRNAERTITPLIEKVNFSKPSIPVIINVNAEVVQDPQEIKTLVCKQLVSPVQWRNTVTTAYKLGTRNFVEIAPARVLSSIVQNRIKQCRNCTTEMIKV